jgi:aspartate aminotransferase
MARLVADVAALRQSSELHRVLDRVLARGREGLQVVRLERGEPDFDTPAHIVEALARAARDGETHYPDSRGHRPLREALAEKLTTENQIPCSPDQIVVTAGGTHALHLAFQTLLGPGDEVLVFSPYWMAIPKMVALTRQGTERSLPVYLDVQSGSLEPAALASRLRAALGPRTRGLYLNTPNNPTGVVLSRAHLEALAEVCRERDLWVVSDEAYEHLVFDGAQHVSFASLPGMAGRTVSCFTFSKSYAMTGWRLGYLVGPREVADVAGPLLSFYSTHGVFPAVQSAGLAALRGPQQAVTEMRDAYQARRDRLLAGLREVPGVRAARPDGAFYVFAEVGALRAGRDPWELVDEWVDAGVAVLPGIAFGPEYLDHVRISVAASTEDLDEAALRLRVAGIGARGAASGLTAREPA